jgi:PAS domain S-box-containing protein
MSPADTGTYWIIIMITGMTLALAAAVVGAVVVNQRNRLRHNQEKLDLVLAGERRYHDLFHGVSDVVYVHTLAGEIVEINQRGAEILNTPPDDLRSRNIREFLPEKYRAAYERYLDTLRTATEEVKGHLPYRSRVGRELVVLEFSGSLYGAGIDGAATVRGIARDVTDHFRLLKAHRRMEEKTKALLSAAILAQRKLSSLSHGILRMQEDDRRRIGRELHDEVGQLLVAVGVNLDVIKNMLASPDGPVRDRLDDTKRITENILDRVRRVLREFRSLDVETKGLIPSLRAYIGEYSGRTGTAVNFSEDDLAEILNYDQKVAVYRIVQECLTNAARYARASEIAVTMRCRDDELSLEVRDNGAGFDVERQNSDFSGHHTGILGMRERVNVLNGRFGIESRPGEGTLVRVIIPFSEGSPEPAHTGEDADEIG